MLLAVAGIDGWTVRGTGLILDVFRVVELLLLAQWCMGSFLCDSLEEGRHDSLFFSFRSSFFSSSLGSTALRQGNEDKYGEAQRVDASTSASR